MKRAFLAVCAAGSLALLVSSSIAAPRPKVKLCHATRVDGGHVVEVAEPAVQAHLNHGDSVEAAADLEVGAACTFGDRLPE